MATQPTKDRQSANLEWAGPHWTCALGRCEREEARLRRAQNAAPPIPPDGDGRFTRWGRKETALRFDAARERDATDKDGRSSPFRTFYTTARPFPQTK